MTEPKAIVIELITDTTFSRGEGTAGVVDVEVEHDNLGMPFLGGKTLRGLLRDAWLSMAACFPEPELSIAASRVHGPVGDMSEVSILRIGDVVIEEGIRQWIRSAQMRNQYPLTAAKTLAALTDIRHQTAEERHTGAPAKTTLRASRVIIRGLQLEAPLLWMEAPSSHDVRCLALSVLGTRHAGLGRNRGRGHIQISLDGNLADTRDLARGNQS